MSDPTIISAPAGWEHLLWLNNFGPGAFWRSAIVGWAIVRGRACPVTATRYEDDGGVIARRIAEGSAGFGLRRPDGTVEDDGDIYASESEWLAQMLPHYATAPCSSEDAA
jgi:hypothetical protein